MPLVAREGCKSFGKVYCTSCTRTVEAEIVIHLRPGSRSASLHATPGQKCPRCSALLDAAFVMANSPARAA